MVPGHNFANKKRACVGMTLGEGEGTSGCLAEPDVLDAVAE